MDLQYWQKKTRRKRSSRRMNYLAIFIGGGIGSLLRYLTTVSFKKFQFLNIPLGTFFSNVLASLLLGIIVGFFISKKIENEALKNLLIIGVCGGFSTFSTFSYENYSFLNQSQFLSSLLYILLSVMVSIAAIYIGIFIVNSLKWY